MNVTGGSITNNGNTLVIGAGTLNNGVASAYNLGGLGTTTIAGGKITSTGGGAFVSTNTLSGYGTISAPFTNNGNVTLTGGTSTVSGTFTNQAGANLNIQNNPATFGTVTNANGGTVHVTNATVTFGNFTNNGAYISDPSTQTLNTLTVGSTGYLTGAAGDVFKIQGNFTNNSNQNTLWDTHAATLEIVAGTSNAHTFALAGEDWGQDRNKGYTNNFAWGTLTLDPSQTLTLSDGNTTNNGTALYVQQILGLTFTGDDTGVTDITGNGFDIYYDENIDTALGDKKYNLLDGGYLEPVDFQPSDTGPVPEPSTLIIWSLLGMGSWLGMRVSRRRRGPVAGQTWSPENREAIREIITRGISR